MNFDKFLVYLFLFAGSGNLLMMIDTLFSDQGQAYNLFSFSSSKWINLAFYGAVALFLIYAGIVQQKKINNKHGKNNATMQLSRSEDLE
jgi:hypothetical protein